MKQNILKCLVLFVLVFAVQTGFSQKRLAVSVGTGVALYAGSTGVAANGDIVLPLNSYLSCGLDLGIAMASDKKIDRTQAGAFVQNSIYFGNLNLYYNPKIYKNFRLVIFGGGGIRHHNSTQILVNSNLDLHLNNAFDTGFGFNGGAGFNYAWNNYMIGVKYKLDLYKDGFDYFGLNFGIYLD